jgi:PAS domain-containing protein
MALSDLSDDGRYRLLVEAVTDYAIYMLDPNGVVSSWNPGAQRFKGYDNGSDCFSPRAHRPFGRASIEADARRQAASRAAIQAETSSASLIASSIAAGLQLRS